MSESTSGVRTRPVGDHSHDDKADIRDQLDFSGAHWRGDDNDGSAGGRVEMTQILHTDGITYTCLRHGGDPHGPVLVFTPGEWDAFVAGAKDGEFDRPF
ncbi:DUF397 domain-containing protein [Allokutzneria albata]|uniref:DUF397 domain-containing protein n=1 Tax=Allokutzneria albata TaxID=211114 RepID=A0A1G9XK55_ALLAB|nr:DUF397 domain-containing protein [Allokutzneria albata]SDM96595.1 protein of unknown function [Allokutzneria albata]